MLNKDQHQAQDPKAGDCFHLQDHCELREAADLGNGPTSPELSTERPASAQACSDCILLTQSLNAARLETRSMGDHLIQRLRAVAKTQPLEAQRDPMILSTEDPLESEVQDLLSDTFEQARRPRPMPSALAGDLKAIARNELPGRPTSDAPIRRNPASARAALPWWLADSNWATAACALLTAALMLVAGDSSARFQDLTRIQDLKAAQSLTQFQDLTPFQDLTQFQDLAPDLASVQDLMRFSELPYESVTAAERTEPAPNLPGPDFLASARASGTDAWNGIRDRLASWVNPWIGRVHGRLEAVRITVDAWFGKSAQDPTFSESVSASSGSRSVTSTTASSDNSPSKNTAPLGSEQLLELKLRAREAWNDSKPSPEAGRTRNGKEDP